MYYIRMYNVLQHNSFHQFLGLSVSPTPRGKSLAFHASRQTTPVLCLHAAPQRPAALLHSLH
jgi:hypothetical protein